MKEYYNLIDKIYDVLITDKSINTVTSGDIFDVDLSKQSIFPLAHITTSDVVFGDGFISFSVNVIAMDVVDDFKENKQTTSNPEYTRDNKQDILNTMLTVVNRLQGSVRQGSLNDEGYELANDATATQFEDRFENLLTGWSLTMNMEIRNDNVTFGGTNCD
tara:strand:- start:10446 stop:10928 length:483 start_codon:yes stop_codon:yes gene_type:complete